MKIAIATDHNGVNEKKQLIEKLPEYEFLDLSPENTPTDDYPDFAYRVAKAVINKEADFGVLLCRTGIGMSIAANKVKGIRCAHCSSVEHARLTKTDNDSNVVSLCFTQDINELADIVREFVSTPFSNIERHARRVNKIIQIEEGTYNEL